MSGTVLCVAQGSMCQSTLRHLPSRVRTAVGKPQRCGAAHSATWRVPQHANGCRRGTKARVARGDEDSATEIDTSALTKPIDDAGEALRGLAAAFAALPPSFLERISADQNRDLRDVCFELRTAGPGRAVDPAMDTLLTELSEAVFDEGDGLKASQIASRLELPEELQSPSRAALARRLIGAARYAGLFERTSDAESDAALVALTAALSRAALALAAGTKEENVTKAALVPPKQRQLALGPISLSLTAQQAGIGAGVAYTFAYGSSRLTSIYNGDPNVQFAAAVKAAEAAEIRLILQNTLGDLVYLVGNGCTVLATVVGSVLLFNAWQLVEENFQDMEGTGR